MFRLVQDYGTVLDNAVARAEAKDRAEYTRALERDAALVDESITGASAPERARRPRSHAAVHPSAAVKKKK
jgi:hypothetical protein